MLTGFLIGVTHSARSLQALVLAVAAGACAAVLATIMMMPAAQPMVSVASASQIRLVNDEHAAVGDYLRAQTDADRAAAAAIDRDYADARGRAAAQARPQAMPRIAKLEAPLRKPLKGALVTAPTRGAPEPAKPESSAAAGPPLQLAALTAAAMPAPPKRPVIERVRSVIATVERIPRWVRVGVQDAADWAIDVPGQIIRLPERRFL
jgi:hypothetical protein